MNGIFTKPIKLVFSTLLGTIYVVNPVDILPDVIPYMGQIDDGIIIILTIITIIRILFNKN